MLEERQHECVQAKLLIMSLRNRAAHLWYKISIMQTAVAVKCWLEKEPSNTQLFL